MSFAAAPEPGATGRVDAAAGVAAPAKRRLGLSSITARQWLTLLAVQLSTLLFGMTLTLANVVLPQIRGSLSATPDEVSWVITLNLVATAVATPMTGWLAGRLGWRNVMLLSVSGFTLFSFLSGSAGSLDSLVLYRIGQGIFGAPIMPMGQAIVLASFAPELHTTMMVIWGAGSVLGPVVGPIIGSIIAETYTWRGAFYMIVPAGFAAIVCVWFGLAHLRERTGQRLDWTGFLALSVSISAAQLILARGQRLDWFASGEIQLEAATAIIAFWIFAAHSLTAPRPFLDPRLLRDRNFAIGLLLAFFMGMLSYTSLVLFPGVLHDLRGYPVEEIGLLLSARGVGNWCAFLVVVPFARRWPRLAVACGLAAQGLAAWEMAQLDINLTSLQVFWTSTLQGFGFGLAYTPMTVLAFATLPPSRLAEGSGVFTLLRNFGSSLFISIAVVEVVRSTASNYARMSEFVNPYNPVFHFPGLPQAWNTGSLGGLMRLSHEIQRQAAMIGYINAFYLLAATAAAGVPLVLLLRGMPRAR